MDVVIDLMPSLWTRVTKFLILDKNMKMEVYADYRVNGLFFFIFFYCFLI